MDTTRWGETVDRRGTAGGDKAQREVLEGIKERIGEDRYREIIKALMEGEYDNLSEDDKRLIGEIKQEKGGSSH